jgi:hypothetical protein
MSTTDRPLWEVMEDAYHDALRAAFPCVAVPPPHRNAAMIRAIAAVVEHRGEKGLDLDPGETADWLRAEAARAESGS